MTIHPPVAPPVVVPAPATINAMNPEYVSALRRVTWAWGYRVASTRRKDRLRARRLARRRVLRTWSQWQREEMEWAAQDMAVVGRRWVEVSP